MADSSKTKLFGIFPKDALPEGAEPIKNFDVKKYLGTWYEIARIDFFWEPEKMTNVTATYSANDDGSVKVVNKGYDTEKGKWSEWTGKATLRDAPNVGALSVSFFPGATSGYNVLAEDDNYKYALVAGRNLDFLWFLSRETTMPKNIKSKYEKMAKKLGYDLNRLDWTAQDKNS